MFRQQKDKSQGAHTRSLEAARVARLLLLSLVTGCAIEPIEETQAEAGEEGSTRTAERPIENGEYRPSDLNGGTVLIQTWLQVPREDDVLERCTGQVISRDTILTAAHCFGTYGDGWVRKKAVKVGVRHQNPNGSWEHLVNSDGEILDLYVLQSYVNALHPPHPHRYGLDIAVLQRRSKFDNIEQSDVAAFARDTASRPSLLYVYGHGYHTDTSFDGNLRRGRFTGLQYESFHRADDYRTILAQSGANDPHTCKGDSGGPWKEGGFGVVTSGVIFGVHVWGKGLGECAEEQARAATVAYHHSWIADRVREGRGSCQDGMHQVAQGNGWSWTPTRTCW